jgi:hypothetical protein
VREYPARVCVGRYPAQGWVREYPAQVWVREYPARVFVRKYPAQAGPRRQVWVRTCSQTCGCAVARASEGAQAVAQGRGAQVCIL